MDVERITFPDGSWWDIKTVVTRKMRKAFRAAGVQSFMAGMNGDLNVSDAEALKKAIMSRPDAWNLDAVDDAFLLHGTVKVSWQESPPSLEQIDSLPDAMVKTILTRMQELYAEPTEAAVKN